MIKNQVYFHLFVYIVTIIASSYINTKSSQSNASQLFSHSLVKVNANENVGCTQEKN